MVWGRRAGTHFTCSISIKVQILTGVGEAGGEWYGGGGLALTLLAFTSTKVQILTAEARSFVAGEPCGVFFLFMRRVVFGGLGGGADSVYLLYFTDTKVHC